jgi:hypothetical protein
MQRDSRGIGIKRTNQDEPGGRVQPRDDARRVDKLVNAFLKDRAIDSPSFLAKPPVPPGRR